MVKPYNPLLGKKPSKAQLREAERQHAGCDKVLLYGPPQKSYLAFFDDAEERAAKGEVQTRCAKCKRYRWLDEQKACDDFVADKSG